MPITHRTIQTNGIRMHIAEAGEGPLVVLCHGFPESWYSWRHQLAALAEAGFHAVAPDQRGYGQTDRAGGDRRVHAAPPGRRHHRPDRRARRERRSIAGHDWGAPVAWNTALLRPGPVPRRSSALSVPYRRARHRCRPTDGDARRGVRRDLLPALLPGTGRGRGRAGARCPRVDPRLRSTARSGDAPVRARDRAVPRRRRLPRPMAEPAALPAWLTEADLDFYTAEFTRTGFRGGLNWYRNIDRNWELIGGVGRARR